MNYKEAVIRIECTGSDILPLDAMEEFQGGLKTGTGKTTIVKEIFGDVIQGGLKKTLSINRNTYSLKYSKTKTKQELENAIC